MRRREHRHPAIETAVFAAALILAAFIGRELWRRRAVAVPQATGVQPVALNPSRPPLPGAPGPKRTETSVSMVPAIKLSRVERRKTKLDSIAVPKPD